MEIYVIHIAKRVCLELSLSCRSEDAVQKMEDFLEVVSHAEVDRTELADEIDQKKRIELPQTTVRSSLQITLGCIERKLSLW